MKKNGIKCGEIEIKEWILYRLESRGRASLNISIRNSKDIQKIILEKTTHLTTRETFSERAYHIINGLASIPLCPVCISGRLKFNHTRWEYNKTCSAKCGAKHPDREIKTKNTNMERYGVENVYQDEDIKNRIRKTNLERFGAEYNTQTQEFKDYCKKLNLDRYGKEYYSQTKEFKDKIVNTSMEKYGVDHPSKSKEVKNKLKELNLKKYGVDHQFKAPEIREKISSTIKERYGKNWYTETDGFKEKYRNSSLLKYGTEFPNQNITVKEKIKSTCIEKYGSTSYINSEEHKKNMLDAWGIEFPFHGNYKNYKLPSGRIIKIQGYENYALDLLLSQYAEKDILIVDKEIREGVGKIEYFDKYKNKNRQYLCDIYLIPLNKVIEVKSEFTLMRNLEINLIKRESCISRGLDYEFWVFNSKAELTII